MPDTSTVSVNPGLVAMEIKKFSQGSGKYAHKFFLLGDIPYALYLHQNKWLTDLSLEESLVFYRQR